MMSDRLCFPNKNAVDCVLLCAMGMDLVSNFDESTEHVLLRHLSISLPPPITEPSLPRTVSDTPIFSIKIGHPDHPHYTVYL